ncbi:MAG: CoA transferase, partial [Deltaproteobacteria bacterium]|nr:CoA transferase [Deltaproteobacteria bacterium]
AAALSIAAALVRRIKTGNGAFIDASLLDALDPFLCLAAERQFIEATTAQLAEDIGGGGFACYNVYETNDGKQLAVAAVEEKFWRQFVNLLGKDHLAGDHLNPKGQQPLIQEIAATIKTRSQAEWLKLFEDRNICVTEVNSPLEAFADPPAGGRPSRRGASGFPFAVDGRRPDFRKPTPGLGEQTEAILDALDISRDEQEILRREGVI